ncbi:MAG: nucleoside diphosphate kinase regulator [Pseudoalteromonas prydzensis]|uniref:Nucleoside diphosphate kinase regulator n=1 Tax=Pseudoalteromonas prydzensis TaxID=182141 RepID=A0A7V1CVY5_9GAMM|nr:nucleoside diphosphate kinase regulator [Pseudoalteromonas prydzensis]HEA15297.1 nucleoside diphosphate kinase regulator [Pseudoalteromonas prydzensis]
MNKKPELIISSLDADRLYDLMESLPAGSFADQKELEAELGRATIVEPKDMPSTVVTMNSTVNFIVESTQEEFTKTLVYPKNADASADKISILAPVGSALLGLSQGDEIEWPKPSGGLIKVKIKAITYQPERAGELHR